MIAISMTPIPADQTVPRDAKTGSSQFDRHGTFPQSLFKRSRYSSHGIWKERPTPAYGTVEPDSGGQRTRQRRVVIIVQDRSIIFVVNFDGFSQHPRAITE